MMDYNFSAILHILGFLQWEKIQYKYCLQKKWLFMTTELNKLMNLVKIQIIGMLLGIH